MKNIKSWIADFFRGGREYERHLLRTGNKFYDEQPRDRYAQEPEDEQVEAPIDLVDPQYHEYETGERIGRKQFGGQNFRLDFNGSSEDIDWLEYNPATEELWIKFLEHGEDMNSLYRYSGFPGEMLWPLIDGLGPFPSGREPHYLKKISTGQHMNFYVRNDHVDDLYEYEKLT